VDMVLCLVGLDATITQMHFKFISIS
jgi:hypothetical protein